MKNIIQLDSKLIEKVCDFYISKETTQALLLPHQILNSKDISVKSKLFGLPYWPEKKKDLYEQLVQKHGQLNLVSQINLKDLKDPRLPGSGLLQLYIFDKELLLLEDPFSNFSEVSGNVRQHLVIYHDENSLNSINLKDLSGSVTLDEVSESLIFERVPCTINKSLYEEFDNAGITSFLEDMPAMYNWQMVLSKPGLPDILKTKVIYLIGLMKSSALNQSCFGGHPVFCQYDERLPERKLPELLWRIESSENLMLGDMGNIHVFTTIESLKNIEQEPILDSFYLFQSL